MNKHQLLIGLVAVLALGYFVMTQLSAYEKPASDSNCPPSMAECNEAGQ